MVAFLSDRVCTCMFLSYISMGLSVSCDRGISWSSSLACYRRVLFIE